MTYMIGSLCTGTGALDMAVLEAIGGYVAWHADPDPGASAILAHRWPAIPNHGDITTLDYETVAKVGILTAGFPCTDVSVAGLREGITATNRSGLWHHVARAIDHLRPAMVVIENVEGLLSARADRGLGPTDPHVEAAGPDALRALGCVLGDLADLGFDAEWCRVAAAEVGAAHRRNRVFILAWPADAAGAGQSGPRLRGRLAERGAATADSTLLGRERSGLARDRRPGPADGGVTAADTASERPRTRQPEPAWVEGRLGVAGGGTPTPADTDSDALRQQPERQSRCGGTALARHARPDVPAVADWGVYGPAVARWATVHGAPAPRPTDDHARLSPAFVEWLMGLPAGHVTDVPGLTRTAQLHALGNGVVPAQAAAALRLLLDRACLEAAS